MRLKVANRARRDPDGSGDLAERPIRITELSLLRAEERLAAEHAPPVRPALSGAARRVRDGAELEERWQRGCAIARQSEVVASEERLARVQARLELVLAALARTEDTPDGDEVWCPDCHGWRNTGTCFPCWRHVEDAVLLAGNWKRRAHR